MLNSSPLPAKFQQRYHIIPAEKYTRRFERMKILANGRLADVSLCYDKHRKRSVVIKTIDFSAIHSQVQPAYGENPDSNSYTNTVAHAASNGSQSQRQTVSRSQSQSKAVSQTVPLPSESEYQGEYIETLEKAVYNKSEKVMELEAVEREVSCVKELTRAHAKHVVGFVEVFVLEKTEVLCCCFDAYLVTTKKLLTILGKFELPEIAAWASQVLEGLKEIHSQGITHFDIKPSNILIEIDGNVRICDFGSVVPSSHVINEKATVLPTNSIAKTTSTTANRNSNQLLLNKKANSMNSRNLTLRRFKVKRINSGGSLLSVGSDGLNSTHSLQTSKSANAALEISRNSRNMQSQNQSPISRISVRRRTLLWNSASCRDMKLVKDLDYYVTFTPFYAAPEAFVLRAKQTIKPSKRKTGNSRTREGLKRENYEWEDLLQPNYFNEELDLEKCDEYSVGMSLLELIAGYHPLQGSGQDDLDDLDFALDKVIRKTLKTAEDNSRKGKKDISFLQLIFSEMIEFSSEETSMLLGSYNNAFSKTYLKNESSDDEKAVFESFLRGLLVIESKSRYNAVKGLQHQFLKDIKPYDARKTLKEVVRKAERVVGRLDEMDKKNEPN